jgi:hypothetical protein
MAEILPGKDADLQQLVIHLLDRADRFEEQLESTLDRIRQLEEKIEELEQQFLA